jgi:hypothetical protein
MRKMIRFWFCPVAVAIALVVGCTSSTGPGVEPEITNAVDNFQYQVTSVQNYTHHTSYTWQNTGAQANVNQATTITRGNATLIILDGAGTQVYSRSLVDNGTFATEMGTPGSWTIRIAYYSASGTVNFRVQKRP